MTQTERTAPIIGSARINQRRSINGLAQSPDPFALRHVLQSFVAALILVAERTIAPADVFVQSTVNKLTLRDSYDRIRTRVGGTYHLYVDRALEALMFAVLTMIAESGARPSPAPSPLNVVGKADPHP